MIEIPYSELQQETLRALIESFILREGTDYGERELDLDEKVFNIESQLKDGKLKIVFDEREETCNIISSEQLCSVLKGF